MWGQQGWKSLANEGREKLNSPVTSSWGDETFASGRDSSQYVKSKVPTLTGICGSRAQVPVVT